MLHRHSETKGIGYCVFKTITPFTISKMTSIFTNYGFWVFFFCISVQGMRILFLIWKLELAGVFGFPSGVAPQWVKCVSGGHVHIHLTGKWAKPCDPCLERTGGDRGRWATHEKLWDLRQRTQNPMADGRGRRAVFCQWPVLTSEKTSLLFLFP